MARVIRQSPEAKGNPGSSRLNASRAVEGSVSRNASEYLLASLNLLRINNGPYDVKPGDCDGQEMAANQERVAVLPADTMGGGRL